MCIKGTVSIISSDFPCKDGNARFTTDPLKAFSDQVLIDVKCFCFFKLFNFICGCSTKVACEVVYISCLKDGIEKSTEINTFRRRYFPHF